MHAHKFLCAARLLPENQQKHNLLFAAPQVSYLEIYNDQLYDLLSENPGTSEHLSVTEDSNGNTFVSQQGIVGASLTPTKHMQHENTWLQRTRRWTTLYWSLACGMVATSLKSGCFRSTLPGTRGSIWGLGNIWWLLFSVVVSVVLHVLAVCGTVCGFSASSRSLLSAILNHAALLRTAVQGPSCITAITLSPVSEQGAVAKEMTPGLGRKPWFLTAPPLQQETVITSFVNCTTGDLLTVLRV